MNEIDKILQDFEKYFGNTSDKQYDDWTDDYYLSANWLEVKDWLKDQLTKYGEDEYERGWGKGWTEGYTEGVESMV